MNMTNDDLNIAMYFGQDIIAKAKERRLTPQQFREALFMTACSVGAQLLDAEGPSVDGIKYTCSDSVSALQLTIERVYAGAPDHPITH